MKSSRRGQQPARLEVGRQPAGGCQTAHAGNAHCSCIHADTMALAQLHTPRHGSLPTPTCTSSSKFNLSCLSSSQWSICFSSFQPDLAIFSGSVPLRGLPHSAPHRSLRHCCRTAGKLSGSYLSTLSINCRSRSYLRMRGLHHVSANTKMLRLQHPLDATDQSNPYCQSNGATAPLCSSLERSRQVAVT